MRTYQHTRAVRRSALAVQLSEEVRPLLQFLQQIAIEPLVLYNTKADHGRIVSMRGAYTEMWLLPHDSAAPASSVVLG
jgi:hypothetical protein